MVFLALSLIPDCKCASRVLSRRSMWSSGSPVCRMTSHHRCRLTPLGHSPRPLHPGLTCNKLRRHSSDQKASVGTQKNLNNTQNCHTLTLFPYQNIHVGLCGVEVEGGKTSTTCKSFECRFKALKSIAHLTDPSFFMKGTSGEDQGLSE